MAALDGATKSLMQGVSQQVPRERLDGQVSLQSNMLSDPVDGMRRRPGMRQLQTGIFDTFGWNKDQVFACAVDIEDTSYHVIINTANGSRNVYTEDWIPVALTTHPYLIAPDASYIQVATLRGYLYIANTSIKPSKVVSNAGRQDPTKTGFFFIKTGQYSKIYNITVVINGVPTTVTYTTPDGTTAGDAAKATPEYIANQLANSLVLAGIPAVLTGAYVFIVTTMPGVLSVTSDSGATFVGASNTSNVSLVSDLPARLPAVADGALVVVGPNPRLGVWYQYSYARNAWIEAGAYNSATDLANMPMRMSLTVDAVMETPQNEGRLAGSDDTNEDPAFLTDGISGLSAFQGRLVLLSGGTVCMSASGKPLRWYRSTTTELLVADPISVFSGAATTANFTHAVQFNKDLVLFSKSVQAVVPSGNAIVSPSTAQIVITSAYSCTSKVVPTVAGRSLLYFSPRSEQFAGTLEMVPSNTTDSQYTTNDITAHLPKYMPGTIRQAVASTTSNSAALVADGDARTLFIYQYLWGDDGKIQAAWHSWTAPYDISAVWFVRDTIFIGMVVDEAFCIVSVDTQSGDTINGLYRPFSDLFQSVVVSGSTFTIPASLRPAVLAGAEMQLTYATGTAAGDAVGFTYDPDTWIGTVVRNVPDGTYMTGLKYTSALSPTPPLLRDSNGVVIGTAGTVLIRYEATMRNTGAFDVLVQRRSETISDGTYSGLLYSSEDLLPNAPLYTDVSRVVIPVRLNPDISSVILSAKEDHDMGVLTLEYVMQYHQRRRRA